PALLLQYSKPHSYWNSLTLYLNHLTPYLRDQAVRSFWRPAEVNGDIPAAEGPSESDSGAEMTNENSPLTAAEPPSPFSPKQNGDAASPAGVGGSESGSGLRQRPSPRTIFQAGLLAPHTKPRSREQRRGGRQSKLEHRSSPLSLACSVGSGPLVSVDNKGFGIGEMVWGKIKGFSWWPGIVVTWRATGKRQATHGMRWLQWFGDGKFSEVSADKLDSITAFPKFFNQASYAKLASYRRAIFQALEMASLRAEKPFPPCESEGPEDQVKPMLDWANGGFLPKGQEGLKPTENPDSNPLNHKVLDVSLPEYFPTAKRPRISLCKAKSSPEEVYSREQMVHEVLKNNRSIEEFCLSCGKTRAATFHPLFEGGLCQAC
ncbi:unnamed protein product, partial [Coregonus sp. 'balchen']